MAFGELFLKDPSRFPEAAGGEPWGDETIEITLAGLQFRFSGLSQRQAATVRERYGDFVGAAGEGLEPVPIRLWFAPQTGFRPIEIRPWVYTIDRDPLPRRVRLAGLNLMALLDWQSLFGADLWTSVESGGDFRLVFENVFRIVTAYAVLRRGGVLLHSAGISDGESAWIGFGHSGAGKTTLSRLSLAAGKSVLSDDINILLPEAGRWYAQRIPFAGELGPTHGQRGRYPVQGLYRLCKGEVHRLEPQGRTQSLAALLASMPFVNDDPYRLDELLGVLDRLLAAVPCHRLWFRRDPGFWSLLEAAPPNRSDAVSASAQSYA